MRKHENSPALDAIFNWANANKIPAAEQAWLWDAYRQSGTLSLERRLVAANAAQVIAAVMAMRGKIFAKQVLEDAVVEAMIELQIAIRRARHTFDPARGNAFASYCSPMLLVNVGRAMKEVYGALRTVKLNSPRYYVGRQVEIATIRKLSDAMPSPEDGASDREERRLFQAALDTLPRPERFAVSAAAKGLSRAKAAKMLGFNSPQTAGNYERRGMAKIRARVGKVG